MVDPQKPPSTARPRKSMKDGFGLAKIESITAKMEALSLSLENDGGLPENASQEDNSKHPIPSDADNVRSSDRQTLTTSDRQIGASDRQTEQASDRQIGASDRQTEQASDRQIVRSSDAENVRSSDRQTEQASDRQTPGASDRQIEKRITLSQKPVLDWIDRNCQDPNKVITYGQVGVGLGITERAARTHIQALEKYGYIKTSVATFGGGKQPRGKRITLLPAAKIALALAQSSCFNIQPQNASDRQIVRSSDRQTPGESDRQIVRSSDEVTGQASDRQTYCSSSILKTTTTSEPLPVEGLDDKFDQLILDDWEQWGLRPAAISKYLALPLPVLQSLLDKTAHVIRKREATADPVEAKIGFLVAILKKEFCDVDSTYVSREEILIKKRMEAQKEELARIKTLKEAAQEVALELLVAQLSEEELSAIREQTIAQIREEMKSPNMEPGEAMVSSYKNTILLSLAKERGLF